MKYQDVNEENLPQLKKYEESDIDILWINDFYDGPLDSMCAVVGEMCKSIMICQSDNEAGVGWYRKYVLLRLSERQLKEELFWHNEFKKYVGNHWDNTEEEIERGRIRHSQSMHSKFYEPYKQYKQDWSNNEVVGWYET